MFLNVLLPEVGVDKMFDELRNKVLLVTGAAGFIGSHLVDELLRQGAKVIGVDNFLTGTVLNLSKATKDNNFRFVFCDIRDYEHLSRLMKKVYFVFHQAALVNVRRSVEMPLLTHEINATGTLNVLLAAKNANVKRVIFASSASVYGDSPILPKKEDMGVKPLSPYGVTKCMGEQYCYSFSKVYDLETVCLRYFNIFGPRQSDNPYSGVIRIFLSRARSNEPLTVFGDGTQTRDFTFVENVVRANLLATVYDEADGTPFNISCGTPTSINEIVNRILNLTGSSSEIVHVDPRPGEIHHSYADINRAKSELHYNPEVDVDTGLVKLYNYVKSERSRENA